jgi:hypothetical protein
MHNLTQSTFIEAERPGEIEVRGMRHASRAIASGFGIGTP